MVQRNAKIGALAIAVLMVGCAKNNYPLTAQERQLYMPVDRGLIAKARDQKIPKIKAETHLAAAKLLEQQGDIKRAVAQYRKAINSDNKLSEGYHRLGVLLSMLGQNDEATKILRRAVSLSPKQPVLHNDFGFALTLQSQWAEAEREFRKSIALEPRFARAYINLGLTLSKMDRFDEAKTAFMAVLPEQDTYYNLGLMYRSMQRFSEAAEAFRYVLEVEPEFSAATAQLKTLRDLVPTQPKSALPNPKENFAYQPIKIEKTRLVKIDRSNPTKLVKQQSELEKYFENTANVSTESLEIQSPTIAKRNDSSVVDAKPVTPNNAITKSNQNNLSPDDLVQIVQASSGKPELIDNWTADELRDAPNVVAIAQPNPDESAELVSYLDEDEIVLTPAELSMSPIGEIVFEVNHFSVADEWSAWTHLSANAIADSYIQDASVSLWASLSIMGNDLHEVRSEINCLEDELEARLAENNAREAAAVELMLADATPDDTFNWLLTRSPMVSPEPIFELELFMPMPPLSPDYISLIAEQVGPSVDIERIWSGESEVGSIPFTLASATPCDVEKARPLLSSLVLESAVLESFLPETDVPHFWSPLPTPSRLELAGWDNTFPEFDYNNGVGPFDWVERFAVLDNGLSVLINETRCRNNQWRLEEIEPELLGYCRSDFVQACEPGITDIPPFLEVDGAAKTSPLLRSWLGSSGNR